MQMMKTGGPTSRCVQLVSPGRGRWTPRGLVTWYFWKRVALMQYLEDLPSAVAAQEAQIPQPLPWTIKSLVLGPSGSD